MNEPNTPGEGGVAFEGQPANPGPQMDLGDDFGAGDEKISRGNKGMFLVFLVILIVAAIVAVIWYRDSSDQDKWEKQLKAAMSLPDGDFEAALRELMQKTERLGILEQAAFELGEAKDVLAVPLLVQMVGKGGALGRESAKALAKIGGNEATTGTDAIHSQMNLAEGLAKAEYAWALCTLGDTRGFPVLLESVASRIITAKSLPEFDPDLIMRLGSTDKLIEFSKHQDPMLQMYAATELGFRRDSDTVPALLELVKSKNLDVAESAAISLGRTADKRAGPALLETMRTKPALKDSILGAITQSVGSPGLEVIYRNVKDPAFKYKIIGKLKKLNDPRSADLLLEIANEEVPSYTSPNKPETEMTEAEKKAARKRREADEIRNQAIWTLENLGDHRIAEMMFEKTKWERISEELIPDAAIRYRQDDMSRKIANGVVTWLGKIRPEGSSDYLMKIYEVNKPYSNTPECAQRVTVDIGPLMEAMGRSGDPRFCSVITPFLEKDEGFFFQAASQAIARLKCKGALKDFVKRMKMTKEERKEERFAQLLESRDWQMEDRLQERRNSIMAVKYLEDPGASKALMEILEDPKDDQELRKEAAASLAYCADEKTMDEIVTKLKDTSIDIIVRAALIQGLWHNPSPSAVEAMMQILEGQGDFELVKPAAIAVGESADPANHDRLNKLLDHSDEHRRRAAVLAILLGGNMTRINRVLELLKGQENSLLIRKWYEEHPVFLTKKMFDTKTIFVRLTNAKLLADKTENTGNDVLWPWKHLMQRLKNGWDEAPGGLTKLEIRHLMSDAVRSDPKYGNLAAEMLGSLSERGRLLALQAEKGPQSTIARDTLRKLNTKSL